MKVLHGFSITPTSDLMARHSSFDEDGEYPVIATKEEMAKTLVLVADDENEFHWVDLQRDCFLYRIKGLPGFGFSCWNEEGD